MPSNGHSESGKTRSVTSTSRSLLDRARHDDAQAWDQLVSLYAPLLYYWCRRSNLVSQDIPDVVQDVFHSVARGLQGFRSDRDRGTFRGWLRVITRNKINDRLRRNRYEPAAAGGTEAQQQLLQVADCPLDSDADPPTEELALFHRALELIRDDFHANTWQAFWKVVVESKSPADVADELSMTPGAVRVAKSRVLHRLRQRLGDVWT